jgi:hypothetical protein
VVAQLIVDLDMVVVAHNTTAETAEQAGLVVVAVVPQATQ